MSSTKDNGHSISRSETGGWPVEDTYHNITQILPEEAQRSSPHTHSQSEANSALTHSLYLRLTVHQVGVGRLVPPDKLHLGIGERIKI